MHSIKYDEVINKASLVALASPKEIKHSIPRKTRWDLMNPDERNEVKEEFKASNPGKTFYAPSFKTGKLPAYSWMHTPREYKGYDDPVYGSAVLCNYLPEYDLYLSVIDLDSPKNENDVPIDDLLNVCEGLLKTTHTRKTPSGGYHIYLLSKNKPELKQPSFNIDYQTNTGKRKGKYVVCNYRYGIKYNDNSIDLNKFYKENKELKLENFSFHKEEYTQVKNSPDEVLVVESTDEVLSKIIQEIEEKRLWTPPIKKTIKIVEHNREVKSQKDTEDLIRILKGYVREGTRDELAKSVSGYLYKKGYNLDKCTQIFKEVFHDDEEIEHRIDLLERTFNKPKKEVAGIGALRELLSPRDINSIKSIVENHKKPDRKEIDFNVIDIDERIAYYLEYGYNVTDKMIIESVEKNSTLFFESSTLNYYVKNGDETIRQIDSLFIVNHCNKLFGYNEVSRKQCERVLNFITRPIKMKPYVLQFTNGMLVINNDDNTLTFHENEFCQDFIPKIIFPFRWNSNADGGKIQEAVENILSTKKNGFKDNKDVFLKCVGHSCMGGIEKGIFPIIVGKPGAGKSTLLTMLKRFFSYSEVPIPDIIKNDRFTLSPMVGKHVNIDDDLQSDVWKGIGKLNTIITGNGGSVEIKGENERITLNSYNTPKLWGGSNAVPPVVGDGFERRMIILIADITLSPDNVDDSFQMDILNGKYDEGLEWLIFQSINLYMDNRSKPFVSVEHKEAMIKEHKFKSDPLKSAIEFIFIDSDVNDLEVRVVNREIKNWFRWATRKGYIFDEHKKPSMRAIKNAMDRAGYFQTMKRFHDENGDSRTHRVYEDIKINKDWLIIYANFEEGTEILV